MNEKGAEDRLLTGHLADRHARSRSQGDLSPAGRSHLCIYAGPKRAAPDHMERLPVSAARGVPRNFSATAPRRSAGRGSSWCAEQHPNFRMPGKLSRRPHDAGFLRLGHQQFRRDGKLLTAFVEYAPAPRVPRLDHRPAVVLRGRSDAQRLRVQDSRRTWTRDIAIASPSYGCVPDAMPRACACFTCGCVRRCASTMR